MSDETTNYDELFANGPAPEGTDEAPPQPEPVADAAPVQPTPEATTQPAPQATDNDNPFTADDPRHKAFEMQRKALQDKAEAAAQRAAMEAVAQRDQQWQQMLTQHQQQAQQQDEPKPDPMLDPEGYEAWMERQVERKLAERDAKWEQRFAEQQQREYARYTQALMQDAGAPVETLQAALAFVQEKQPYMIAGLNQAPNPYRAVLDHARLIGFVVPGQPTPQPSVNPLAQQAQQAAAAGVTPQITAPRGVGSVAGGQGYGNEALPDVSEFKRVAKADPDRWSSMVDDIIAQGPPPRQ